MRGSGRDSEGAEPPPSCTRSRRWNNRFFGVGNGDGVGAAARQLAPLYFVREEFAGTSTFPSGRRGRCACVHPCTPGVQEKKGGGKVGLRQDLSSRSPAGVNGLTSAQRVREPRPGRMLRRARQAAPDACCIAPGGFAQAPSPGVCLVLAKKKRGKVVPTLFMVPKASLQKTLQVG